MMSDSNKLKKAIANRDAKSIIKWIRLRNTSLKMENKETCPWCKSQNTKASQCLNCSAFSIDYGLIENATLEELKKGWFEGNKI